MARFLFVVPPLAGHVNPTIGVAQKLVDQGHKVAWVGSTAVLSNLLPQDSKIFGLDEKNMLEHSESWVEKARSSFGLDSFKFFFEEFLFPLCDLMMPSVRDAINAFKPDLVVSDQQALAGALGARLEKIPYATFVTTTAALNPLEQFAKVKEWMHQKYDEVQKLYGLDCVDRPDLSKDLVVIFSVQELLKSSEIISPQFHFVGPSVRQDLQPKAFPWERLDTAKKRIYISLGTLNSERSGQFWQKIKEAFGQTDLQIIVSASPKFFGEIPANFIVQKNIPQLELLKRVNAVIFHGGHNTLCEALNEGLPLVVAPIKDDQPIVAEQVQRSGAGLRVHFARVKSEEIYNATRRVLDEPLFRTAAQNLQRLLKSSGGAGQAAELLTKLALKSSSNQINTLIRSN